MEEEKILKKLEQMEIKQDARFAEQDKRFAKQDERFEAQDKKWDARFAEQDKKWDARFAEQDKRFAKQDERFEAQDKKWESRFDELMEFLQENMATKEDLRVLTNEFNEFRVETEGNFRMIRGELDDIKSRLERLEKRTIEDADATAHDIMDLRKRVDDLEKQIELLKSMQAV